MAKRQRYGDAILHLFSCLIYQNQNEILDRFCSYCCCKLCCFTTRTNFRTKTNRWMAKRKRYGRYGKEIQSNPPSTNRWMAKRKRYGFNGKIFHSTHQPIGGWQNGCSFMPHIKPIGGWQNGCSFSPIKKIGGWQNKCFVPRRRIGCFRPRRSFCVPHFGGFHGCAVPHSFHC